MCHTLNNIQIFALGLMGCLLCGLPATAVAKKQKTAPAADTTITVERDTGRRIWAADPTEAFIRIGEMVAERDIALFTSDLLKTYKELKGDERNLTRLFLRCDRDWGAMAYALAIQAASRKPMRVVLVNYDYAGRNWQRTAGRMRMIYGGNLKPTYTFGIYLMRQEIAWRKMLDEPSRWRRTFLNL